MNIVALFSQVCQSILSLSGLENSNTRKNKRPKWLRNVYIFTFAQRKTVSFRITSKDFKQFELIQSGSSLINGHFYLMNFANGTEKKWKLIEKRIKWWKVSTTHSSHLPFFLSMVESTSFSVSHWKQFAQIRSWVNFKMMQRFLWENKVCPLELHPYNFSTFFHPKKWFSARAEKKVIIVKLAILDTKMWTVPGFQPSKNFIVEAFSP